MTRDPAYERSCDVMVIGAGLAGLFAAAVLATSGLKTIVVAEGPGSVVVSTGSIDVLRRTPEGQPVTNPTAAIPRFAASWPQHPYAKVGNGTVGLAENLLVHMLEDAGLSYTSSSDAANTMAVTALGMLKPTHMLPESFATDLAIRRARRITVASFAGLLDFSAPLVAGNLAEQFPTARIDSVVVSLPEWLRAGATGRVKTPFIAKWFDSEEGREALGENIRKAISHGPSPELLLMPAVLGLERHTEVRKWLCNRLGIEVLEIPTVPPSVPGMRLFSALYRDLLARKIEVQLNAKAASAGVKGGWVEFIDVRSEGKTVRYRPRFSVLASGGVAGGGLIEQGGQMREPVFGIPVRTECCLPMTSCAYAPEVGVLVDEGMRVQGFANLFACGRVLGGFNPYLEGCGNGVAISTALKACQSIGKGEPQ